MQILILPMVLIIGLTQVFAMVDALIHLVGLPGFFAYPLAFVVGPIPVLGTAAGITGAALVWGWGWINATMLFAGPLALGVIVFGRQLWDE